MKLAYEAYDRSGKRVTDSIDAADRHDAGEQLRKRGLFVTKLNEQAEASTPRQKNGASHGRTNGSGKRPKGNLRQLAMFTRQLQVLARTGTPLVEALNSLERQNRDPGWREVIAALKQRVEEGVALSEAMADHPRCFDPVYRSLVAAGESSGKFDAMLDRLAQLVRRQLHVRNTVVGALVYPSLLLTVAVVVLTLMLMFVLPRFTSLFETLDVPLPPTTQVLVLLSEAMRGYWWAMLLGLGGSAIGFVLWQRTANGKHVRDTALVRLPVIGKMTRSFATARLTRLLGTLMDSYVPLLDALALTREAAGNVHYHALMLKAEDAVTRGESISSGFADSDLITPTVYEAIRSGEATGRVGPLLLNVAEFLDEDNEVVLRSLTSILEPIILIGLGILVGLVALSMFLPLFDLTASAGGY